MSLLKSGAGSTRPGRHRGGVADLAGDLCDTAAGARMHVPPAALDVWTPRPRPHGNPKTRRGWTPAPMPLLGRRYLGGRPTNPR